MGFTHYHTLRRRFANADWSEVLTDISAIMATAAEEGIEFGMSDGETRADDRFDCFKDVWDGNPVFAFNGLGEDACETFALPQNRFPLEAWQEKQEHGKMFTKTARRPYDVAVTAILVYLSSCWERHIIVGSDGNVADWQDGKALAIRALPTKANQLEIPFEVRWEEQFDWRGINQYGGRYALRTRVNGDVVITGGKTGYAFLARVPPEKVPAFIEKAQARFASVPKYGAIKEIRAKTDRALRDLLTYPEMTDDVASLTA